MRQNTHQILALKFAHKKRKIAIITAEDRNYPFIQYHDLNFKKYSDIHGYSYFRLDICPKELSTTYWCKIHRVKEFLDSGNYDYVMWADSDTIIQDPILHPVNAGVFLIKNSNIGKSFMNDCLAKLKSKKGCIINGKEQGTWTGICYEQGVMNLLIREKYKDYTFVDLKEEFVFNAGKTDEYEYKNSIVIHLCGHKNDVREKFFKKYI